MMMISHVIYFVSVNFATLYILCKYIQFIYHSKYLIININIRMCGFVHKVLIILLQYITLIFSRILTKDVYFLITSSFPFDINPFYSSLNISYIYFMSNFFDM